MEVFFENIIELIKAGNWQGVGTATLYTLGVAIGSIGGIGGIIAIISKFFTNNKFLSKFKDFIINKITELQAKVLEYKTNAELQIKEYADKLEQAQKQIIEFKTHFEEMYEQQQAFYLVILNNEILQTQFKNALLQVQLAKTKSIEAIQQVQVAVESTQEVVNTTAEIVETETKKPKLKLRKKE